MSVPSFDGSGLRTIFPQLSEVQVDTLLADNDFDVARAAAAAVLMLEQQAPAPTTTTVETKDVAHKSTEAEAKQESWSDRFGSWLSVLITADDDEDDIVDHAPVAWTPCEEPLIQSIRSDQWVGADITFATPASDTEAGMDASERRQGAGTDQYCSSSDPDEDSGDEATHEWQNVQTLKLLPVGS